MSAAGTRKTDEDEAILLTASGHFPLLLSTSGSSANAPAQTLANLPSSAIARSSRGVTASPETEMRCGLAASLLKISILALFAPALPGWKRMIRSIESPMPTTSG